MTKSMGSEEEPIDLSDPDLAVAATKIQANFRGHIARKTGTPAEKKKDEEQDKELAKDMEQLKTAEEEEIDIDLNDPAVEAAAAKIQASFKSHMKLKKKTGTK
ncbi:unnamed protein product [Notodromas monacha]|uniref:Neuromodulin n=1 Tax=Notodromas monacha TaxID=399045 RepID=A0A7R9BM18_9CRUS|nr:unnamed protein product [Notodromas monacha]CAG0917983.1 unnamed protein product [Notodromas monacha]